MLNIQTQHKFKYAHQQILFLNFFSMLNSFINTAHSALALAIGHFFFSGGAEEGACGAMQFMVLKNALQDAVLGYMSCIY